MTIFLKQNTASQELILGPFVSSTDGLTPKTGLSIASTDINIWKTGSTSLTTCSTAASEIGGGNYCVVLSAADTNTLGPMVLYTKPSGALMVRLELAVLPANVYDSWFGTDVQDVSVTQWNGTAVHAPGTAGVPLVDIHDAATATIGTVTTLTNLPAVTADWLTAAGVKADAVTKIQTGLATPTNITAGTITTATNVTTVNGIANGAITAAAIANSAIDLATFAADCKTGSALKANVETITTDAISAAAVSAAAVTKIQTGLATPTNITAGTITTVTNLTNLPAAGATAAELAKVPKSDGAVSWNATALAAINAEVDTALNTAIPGVPTANSINERIAAIDDLTQASGTGDLAAIKTTIGTAGAGLTAVPWNATWDAQVESECTDALNAYDPPTNAEMEARTLVSASYFDPAADTVARVTLVDTCTVNTDMRGTNSAALASVCTDARLAELDAANLPADVAAIDTAVDSILPFVYRHYKITAPVFDASHNMTSCVITRYPTKADKVADTNGVVYNVVATYDLNGDLATYSEEGAV